MKIALAKCKNMPGWEKDDEPLHDAFRQRGVDIENPAWDDPDFDWASYDACLIRTTWDYQERRDEFVDWAERVSKVTKLFNPLGIIRWNTHKSYLNDLAANGVPTVSTVWLDAGSTVNLQAILRDKGWEKAFIKPAIGSTARETLRFEASLTGVSAAIKHLDRLLPVEDMMLQPYLESVETDGELSAIFIDGEITHNVRKIPAEGDYRVQDDYGAHDEPFQFSESDLKIARAAVETIQTDLLYARADFLRDNDNKLKLTELELVEPSLFFRHCPTAAEKLADALINRLN